MIMTADFWKSTVEVAIKAAAAAALGVIGTDQLLTAMSVDWAQVGGVALLASIVSVLTAIVAPNPDVRAMRAAAKAEAEKKAAAAAKRAARKATSKK